MNCAWAPEGRQNGVLWFYLKGPSAALWTRVVIERDETDGYNE